MKRCPNPSCGPAFLFGNDRTTCPFCHSRLVDSTAAPAAPDRTILPPDRVLIRGPEQVAAAQREIFLRECFKTVECHGRISEIDHQELFNSKRHKLFNSLLRGEPYQFAHQTIEYTIRVEDISEGFPTEVTDFCLFGSYLGRLQVGDEVVIRARNLNNRRVVKSIFNETTGSAIKPGLQIPAGMIRGAFLTAAVMLITMMCLIIWLFDSGTAAAGIAAILAALMPSVVVLVGIWIAIRSVFPRRRRR